MKERCENTKITLIIIDYDLLAQTYHWRSLWNANEETEISYEEADTQVKVDRGTGSLYGAAEFKCQDAQYETQQRQGQPYFGHQLELKGVLAEKIW